MSSHSIKFDPSGMGTFPKVESDAMEFETEKSKNKQVTISYVMLWIYLHNILKFKSNMYIIVKPPLGWKNNM